MYLRRLMWKLASYSRNAALSRSGVKNEPTVGTMRFSLLRRGSERCSCEQQRAAAGSSGSVSRLVMCG
jgi:hypothetical protein